MFRVDLRQHDVDLAGLDCGGALAEPDTGDGNPYTGNRLGEGSCQQPPLPVRKVVTGGAGNPETDDVRGRVDRKVPQVPGRPQQRLGPGQHPVACSSELGETTRPALDQAGTDLGFQPAQPARQGRHAQVQMRGGAPKVAVPVQRHQVGQQV